MGDRVPGMESFLETLLFSKARISLAELDVGDVGIKAMLLAEGEIGLAEIIAVSTEGLASEKIRVLADLDHILLCGSQHRGEVFMILCAEGFGMQNDLMFLIDESLGIVALNHTMGTGHLGRLIISEVALDLFGSFASFRLVLLEESIEAFDLTGEAVFLTLAALLLGRRSILAEVLCDLEFELFLELIPFVSEFMKSAAPFLGGIGREFEAVEAEVSAAEQIELIADQQDIAEDGLDLILHGGDKVGNGAVIRGIAAAESHEDDVLAAGAFNFA